jgi:hypothetical protein
MILAYLIIISIFAQNFTRIGDALVPYFVAFTQ